MTPEKLDIPETLFADSDKVEPVIVVQDDNFSDANVNATIRNHIYHSIRVAAHRYLHRAWNKPKTRECLIIACPRHNGINC